MNENERPQPDSTGDPRGGYEGEYTEVDGEPDKEREVHGQYTRTEKSEPDPDIEGDYTESEHKDGSYDAPHSTHERHGRYVRRDE